MSAHARVYINIDNVGIASMNNWMPDAIKSVEEWLIDQGFDVNGLGTDKGNGPHGQTHKERYWIEAESADCTYDVFDHTYISHMLDGWCEEFKDLRFEYSVYNLDIEPDIFITRESVGGRPVGYDSRGD
jgi:hypothetical protein